MKVLFTKLINTVYITDVLILLELKYELYALLPQTTNPAQLNGRVDK